ncbi:MAG: ABC transporter ATP-binding protein [Armatimonadetes bacterium]|nr:ABC transporter ATP-binding protein [Armatimonadota bacterium]
MALSVQGVSKSFGNVRALDSVSVEFEPGEIHAVLGENGAGKSTLMGVLAGFVRPDRGAVVLDGQALRLGDPLSTREAGVRMVHQHFMLVPNFSVAENLALASAQTLWSGLNLERASRGPTSLAARLGWSIDPRARTGGLSVGAQQRVEILKATDGPCRVLILDEPTAVLTPDEVSEAFDYLREIRRAGTAIILIAHKLSEVTGIADRVTVLRQGRVVGQAAMAETDAGQIAEWMVGGRVTSAPTGPAEHGAVLLDVTGLTVLGDRGESTVRSVSLTLHQGEILGIGGVDGNGQVELAEALAGVRPHVSGTVSWPQGAPSVGYIPQDRQTDGLALTMSVADNLAVSRLDDPSARKGPLLRSQVLRESAQSLVKALNIKTPDEQAPAGSLSGGNQQEVVVARAISGKPSVLVAVNPTRGLDIQATADVHNQLRRAAADGAGIVLVSTDLDELDALADRRVFLSRGEFVESLLGAVT